MNEGSIASASTDAQAIHIAVLRSDALKGPPSSVNASQATIVAPSIG